MRHETHSPSPLGSGHLVLARTNYLLFKMFSPVFRRVYHLVRVHPVGMKLIGAGLLEWHLRGAGFLAQPLTLCAQFP